MIDFIRHLSNGRWAASVYLVNHGSRHLRLSFESFDEAYDWATDLLAMDVCVAEMAA